MKINKLFESNRPTFSLEIFPPKKTADAEVEKSIQDRFAMSRKKLDLREKYYKEFRKFLSPRQVEKIYFKEKNYGKAMHKEFSRRKALKNQQCKAVK